MSDPYSEFEPIDVRHPTQLRSIMRISSYFGKIKISAVEDFFLTTEIIDNLIGALEQARPAVGMLDLKVIDKTIEEKRKVFDIKHAESEKARTEYESVVAMRDRLIDEVGLYIPAKENLDG